jgi:hypothetical protein
MRASAAMGAGNRMVTGSAVVIRGAMMMVGSRRGIMLAASRHHIASAFVAAVAVCTLLISTADGSAAQPTTAQARAYNSCLNPCIDRVHPDCMAQRGERTFVYQECWNRGINECRSSCRSHLER